MTTSEPSASTDTRCSPALTARIVRILSPLRCHRCTVPYGRGAPTDERPFGCSVCLDARRLVTEQSGPQPPQRAGRRRGRR